MKSNSQNNAAAMGLLIDTDFCTGCHTCEVACKKEHDIPLGQWGIKLTQIGPFQIGDNEYEYRYSPVPGKLCDLCADRREAGKVPLCVTSCLGKCMDFGLLEELAKKASEKRGNAIWVIEAQSINFIEPAPGVAQNNM